MPAILLQAKGARWVIVGLAGVAVLASRLVAKFMPLIIFNPQLEKPWRGGAANLREENGTALCKCWQYNSSSGMYAGAPHQFKAIRYFHGLSTSRFSFCSRHTQRLHRRRHRIGEEHGVNPLHDVAGDFEKVSFVFERDQCLACAVVHCNLQRLGQGPH